MSTVWRGLCLSHDPAIVFDLTDEAGYELHSSDAAIAVLRKGDGPHARCDVVAGGYSYPLVSVACPHTAGQCFVSKDSHARMWSVEILRLAHQASRLPTEVELSTALTEWLRHNRCWTPDRLSRLLESER